MTNENTFRALLRERNKLLTAISSLESALDQIDCLLSPVDLVERGANDYALTYDAQAVVEKVKTLIRAQTAK